jgi:membrane protease subunit HflC
MSLNKYAILFVVLVILTGILGPQAFFSVDETQVAIVTRFGEVQQTITKPGLHTKTPFVDNVIYYEKRLTLFDAPPDALITSDKRRLVVDAYAIGRITDPLLFRQTVQSQQRAITRGNDIVASELRQLVANDEQIDIIRNNRQAIMEDVHTAVVPKLAEFGIETVDVRIKRADFPSEIATAVYARMQAERKRIADAERADGAKQDLEIRSSVDRQATIISAEAERDANILRGIGEAEAVSIFAAALEQDPEFYRFQRTLEAYKNFLTQNTTVVLPADSDLFSFLQSPGDFFDEANVGDLSGLQFAAGSDEQIVSAAARANLASLLKIDATEPILLGVTAGEWGDASLGCPTEGESYIQVVTPGYSVELTHLGLTYHYHVSTNGANVRLCS